MSNSHWFPVGVWVARESRWAEAFCWWPLPTNYCRCQCSPFQAPHCPAADKGHWKAHWNVVLEKPAMNRQSNPAKPTSSTAQRPKNPGPEQGPPVTFRVALVLVADYSLLSPRKPLVIVSDLEMQHVVINVLFVSMSLCFTCDKRGFISTWRIGIK